MSKDLRNILIIKPSSLGDIVLALPALSALRRSFPEAQISWLIRPEFAPLLQNHPHLSHIIPFDRKFLGRAWYYPKAFGALFSLIWRLRRSKFDAVFDLQGLFRTACLGWLSGCKRRFGMANARELAHIFYTHKIVQSHDSIHLVDYYLKIIKAAGVSDADVRFELPINPADVDSVRRLLASHAIRARDYVVFVPGSAHSDKCWPVERFAELADRISSRFDLPIIAVGINSEKRTVDQIQDLTNAPIVNFAGRTSLGQLIALLKTARLVVSNDTGPGHIAAALGTPLVLMFSWSNPARIAPYGRSECMIAREPYSRGPKIKSPDPKHSVRTITVDEVFQKVCEQIEDSMAF
ncbi:MAG: glycosyltransferase family 9 protein [Sedimentisphaerales bacterium]